MFALLFVLACSGEQGEPKEEEAKVQVDPRSLVDVAAVSKGDVGQHLVASGVVESEGQATLVPETAGRVTGIYVEEGEQVKAGQLLAVIASPSLDAAYERASAELQRTDAELSAAQRLFEQGALSKAELEVAIRARAAARTAHEEASKTRGFTRLVAPIDGTVATRSLRYGEMAGGAPAFVIVQLDGLKVAVHLPERELRRIRLDQPATLVSAWDESIKVPGHVSLIAPIVDAASGTFKVTVAVEPGQTALRPGQYASVRIEVDRHQGVLTVPRRGLIWEEGKPLVYKLVEGPPPEDEKEKKEVEEEKPEQMPEWLAKLTGQEPEKEEEELPGPYRRAVRTPVEIGYEDGDLVEIVSGLTEGETVIVVGNEALRDDARVRLPGDPTVASEADKEKTEADKKPEETKQ